MVKTSMFFCFSSMKKSKWKGRYVINWNFKTRILLTQNLLKFDEYIMFCNAKIPKNQLNQKSLYIKNPRFGRFSEFYAFFYKTNFNSVNDI